MTPYFSDAWLDIYQGDVRDVLPSLPADSVDCIVTSPPYWGLRDYGTASWVGGMTKADPSLQCSCQWEPGGWPDEDHKPDCTSRPPCDHKVGRFEYETPISEKQRSNNGSAGHQARGECPKCGATRSDGQLGLERTPEEYVANMVGVFRELRRVLKPSGTCWLNLGDSYASSGISGTQSETANLSHHGGNGHNPKMAEQVFGRAPTPAGLKPKDLVGIPWRVAFALQADGWYLRSDIIWAKPNPMPESVTDRPTKSHEYLFLLTKSARYYFDADAVREAYSPATDSFNAMKAKYRPELTAETVIGRSKQDPTNPVEGTMSRGNGGLYLNGGATMNPAGRNLRSVWTIATKPYPGAHFAVFPPELPERCIKAGSSERGVCPECGAPWERVVERTNPTRTFGDPKLYRHQPTPTDSRAMPGSGWGDKRAGDPVRETKGWKPPYVPPSELDRYGNGQAGVHRKVGGQYQKWLDDHPKQTVGWNGCTHEVDPVPAVVLDPFAGSGTTGVVANRLSRRAILVDLNGDYLKQQLKRNAQTPLGLGA